MKMKLKKGDTVIVVSGKDKGKTGKIERVLRNDGKVIIEGVAIVKRHLKGRGTNPAGVAQIGQIVERPRAIDASNVMFYDGDSKKGTRIGRETRDGKNVRVSKKGQKVLA
jgi:large subunit ribosomal protein L24